MEKAHIEIELINEGDASLARKGYLRVDDVKKMRLKATIEPGFSCIINESI